MPDAATPSAPPLQQALVALANRQSLSESLAAAVFGVVMRGEASPAQIAGLLVGLRAAMVHVDADGVHLVDTCGTGGGAVGTFNISTGAAFVAAGAGAAVAKHGNRSFTSQCGSADVLEALGIGIGLDAAGAARVLREARVAFLFAPNFHPAMRHVGPVRRELGTPSIMNLLGPLANPAGATRQVVGVADRDRAPLLAAALARLGTEHALVVHGRVGMDEISPIGVTDVWEVRGDEVRPWQLDPGAHHLAVDDAAALRGGDPSANAARLRRLLERERGDAPGLAAVLLNAGAAVYVAGLAASYEEGIARARDAVESGAAGEALQRLRRASPSTSG